MIHYRKQGDEYENEVNTFNGRPHRGKKKTMNRAEKLDAVWDEVFSNRAKAGPWGSGVNIKTGGKNES